MLQFKIFGGLKSILEGPGFKKMEVFWIQINGDLSLNEVRSDHLMIQNTGPLI